LTISNAKRATGRSALRASCRPSAIAPGKTRRCPEAIDSDGRRTNGLAIEKSNWANTLDEPLFEA
jgi:hypothetical protein